MILDLRFNKKTNQRGFTLIETIIYVAIIGGVLVALTSFILSISGSRNKSYAEQEINANARMAFSVLTHKIKSASAINVASSTFGAHPGVLSLAMTSSTLNPTVFALSGGRLSIAEGVSAPQFITDQRITITNLVFTNLSGDGSRGNVGIELNFAYASSTGADYNFTSSLQTAVSLRQ